MKKQFKKWSLRIIVTCIFILGLLIGIILNPILLYARNSTDGNYTIYHQQQLDPSFITSLNNAGKLLASSDLYSSSLKLSICINDGSYYPKLIQTIRGAAFGWGFGKEIVLGGNMNAAGNYIEINGYRWNLTELLAHEATHCLQFNTYGFIHSNPIARIPEWKWEGYAEYVAQKNKAGLIKNISHLLEVENTDNNNWINFDDSTGAVIPYYKSWLLVQYSLDIRKMSYDQLLKDNTKESTLNTEMMAWYNANKK